MYSIICSNLIISKDFFFLKSSKLHSLSPVTEEACLLNKLLVRDQVMGNLAWGI